MITIIIALLLMIFVIVKVHEQFQINQTVTQLKQERAEQGIIELDEIVTQLINKMNSTPRTGYGGPG